MGTPRTWHYPPVFKQLMTVHGVSGASIIEGQKIFLEHFFWVNGGCWIFFPSADSRMTRVTIADRAASRPSAQYQEAAAHNLGLLLTYNKIGKREEETTRGSC